MVNYVSGHGLPRDWLGTIPLRALVPRLKGQMALSNGMKLALDWLGLALDFLGLALIDRFGSLHCRASLALLSQTILR